jgi:Neuraminidase (sialidase)
MSNNSMVTVIKSADMGSTWQVASSLPDEQLMSERAFMSGGLMVFPNSNNPLNLFIATVSYSKGPYSYRATASKVFETKDGGETWQEVYSRDVTEKDGRQDIETIRGVGQMPTSTGRVLFVGGSHGLWRSEDEGETWKRVGGVQ